MEKDRKRVLGRRNSRCEGRDGGSWRSGVISGSPSIVAMVEAEKPGRSASNSLLRALRSHWRLWPSWPPPPALVLGKEDLETGSMGNWGRGVASWGCRWGVGFCPGVREAGTARCERRQVRL